MRPLSANDVVRIWELAQAQHPLDRALTVLGVALPEMTRDSLADLSLGQRDCYLMSLREQTLGPELEGLADCPRCQGRLEFSLRTSELRIPPRDPLEHSEQMLEVGQLKLWVRLPSSRDLAMAAESDVEQARRILAASCVSSIAVAAAHGGAPNAHARHEDAVALTELPEEAIDAISARLADIDPHSEILLNFVCPSCGHQWCSALDIASWFWAEIQALAKRLLREVHVLARAYGWREADILAMSAGRRQAYLDMVG